MQTPQTHSPTVRLSRHHVRLRHHIRVRRRIHHHTSWFLKKTIAAQIHAWAAVISTACVIMLGYMTYSRGWFQMMSVSIFGISAVLLFTASAVMHFLSDGYRVSHRFSVILEDIDKYFINVLIAGTYTAIISISLADPLRTRMLITIWTLALFGIAYTAFYDRLPKFMRSRALYTSQYLAMGWLVLVCVKDVMAALSPAQNALLFVGGGFYSIGAVSYILERPNPTPHFGYPRYGTHSSRLAARVFSRSSS